MMSPKTRPMLLSAFHSTSCERPLPPDFAVRMRVGAMAPFREKWLGRLRLRTRLLQRRRRAQLKRWTRPRRVVAENSVTHLHSLDAVDRLADRVGSRGRRGESGTDRLRRSERHRYQKSWRREQCFRLCGSDGVGYPSPCWCCMPLVLVISLL